MQRRLVLALVAIAIVALVVVALVLGSRPVPPPPSPSPSSPIVTSPSPSPETPAPTATPTESPSATPTPTPVPTPTPRPPAIVIAETWRSVRSFYPWMPDVAVRVQPVPQGEEAYYAGLENGVALVLVKAGASLGLDDWIAWHEAGHAVLDAASKLSHTSTDDILTAYWQLRGFPGTWQEMQAKADAASAAGQTGFAVHQMYPQEMFADTFAATHVDSFADGTVFPGIAYDHARMHAFYSALPFYLPKQLVTHALGPLTGQWAFTDRVGTFAVPFGSAPSPGRAEVWATTSAGIFARYVGTYITELGPALPDTNEIGRELSPDGKRLVVSAGLVAGAGLRYGLVVVDLETGAPHFLTTDATYHDVSPAWSPDGSRIAFARWTTGNNVLDAGIWTIAPDGTGMRRIVPASLAGTQQVYGWTADSTGVAYGVAGNAARYRVADLARGTDVAFAGYLASAGEWRQGTPAFVGAFSDAPFGPPHLDVADAPSAPQRVVVPSSAAGAGASRPRWRPGADQFLYLAGSGLATATVSGQIRPVAAVGTVVAADWTANGEIVYLGQDSVLSSATFRVVGADGSNARDLIALPRPILTWQETYRDLVAVTYR